MKCAKHGFFENNNHYIRFYPAGKQPVYGFHLIFIYTSIKMDNRI